MTYLSHMFDTRFPYETTTDEIKVNFQNFVYLQLVTSFSFPVVSKSFFPNEEAETSEGCCIIYLTNLLFRENSNRVQFKCAVKLPTLILPDSVYTSLKSILFFGELY